MIIKDHKDNLNRELSLVEQKKMQWAREREEMAKLEQYHSQLASKYERNTIRTQLITNTEVVNQKNNFHQKNFNVRRIRSPSLPPIDKTMTRQGSNNSDQSSGYLSGGGGGDGSNSLPPNANNTIDTQPNYDYNYSQTRFDSLDEKFHPNQGHQQHQIQKQQKSLKKLSLTSSLNDYSSSTTNEQEMEYNNSHKSLGTPSSETSSVTSHDVFSVSSFANSSAIESSVTYQKGSREGGRAKWGSYLFDSFSKDNGRSSRNTNGPVWLEKSLNEARDSEEDTMSISMQSVSSFLRGQNVPVDPMVLAERENKRRKAVELQQAIKEQLAERENLKKLEKEKQFHLERMEEERVAKQVEMERKRLEYEQNLQYEKLEAERKKEEAMRKALEKAALDAQLDRERKRREKLAMQNAVDETISVQKIGEKTEIIINQKVESGYNTPRASDENSNASQTLSSDTTNMDGDDEDGDGETILIGTPIKLKKKNLETFRKKFINKRSSNVEDSKTTSDEDEALPKTAKSGESSSEEKPQKKMFSELDGIALVLQSMPLVPFVPLTNEMFAINQLNSLALLMATQNRLNSPNLMLPLIHKDMTMITSNSNDKLDLSQFIIPQNNQQTITLQIQQVEQPKQVVNDDCQTMKIQSVPPSPDLSCQSEKPLEEGKDFKSSDTLDKQHDTLLLPENVTQSIPTTTNESDVNTFSTPTTLPHDGTFTKDECHTHDAFTSTSTESQFDDEAREVKILTPQKYRNELRVKGNNSNTIGTQTESILICEYCSYQHKIQHHHQHCMESQVIDESDAAHNYNQQDTLGKAKEKKSENRPPWGVRNPPMKYIKASERDPFYGKNRKKRYLRKTASESEKTDDTCTHRDCPLVKSSSSLLPKRLEKFDRDNLNKNILPIKYDRFGRICLIDEQNFIENEAFRRISKSDVYTSDAESSVDIKVKQKSFFLPKANDFKDIFVD